MKRILSLFSVLLILLFCTACAGQQASAPAFYYLRVGEDILYGRADALIAPVPQELSQDASLEEQLALYFTVPVEEGFRSPIPKGTRLLSLLCQEDTLVLELSVEFSTLDSIQLSLAQSCLAATCRSLSGYERFQVRSGENVYDFQFQDFVLLDAHPGA